MSLNRLDPELIENARDGYFDKVLGLRRKGADLNATNVARVVAMGPGGPFGSRLLMPHHPSCNDECHDGRIRCLIKTVIAGE
jgi:hypothetical protein